MSKIKAGPTLYLNKDKDALEFGDQIYLALFYSPIAIYDSRATIL
jgi:hypothetical protein